ncbi:hypothetical protein BKA70DRAFT_456942 [Coprinopsis sp. MPI-PUGE-AT-0042]|nr:hypothetical protein BKA70DRAFT_456942 [Coprinopsis sp. MPI-PUGE-AT-0042]
MGPCGSGKSTFINNLLGRPVAKCDSGYAACTSQLCGYEVPRHSPLRSHLELGGNESRKLILIDTPGLDSDKFQGEIYVLEAIRTCLRDGIHKKAVVAGMIYLDNFCLEILREESIAAVHDLQRVCGIGFWPRFILGITHEDHRKTYTQRQGDLLGRFHKGATALGARASPLRNSPESAYTLFQRLIPLTRNTLSPIKIMVDSSFLKSKKKELRTKESIVLIMGEIGAGKSTFVNDLAGGDWAPVKDRLAGDPTIGCYDVPCQERGISTTIVDCPGYNDTNEEEAGINAIIRRFLVHDFSSQCKVTGIIYFIEARNALGKSSAPPAWVRHPKLLCPKLLAVTYFSAQGETSDERGVQICEQVTAKIRDRVVGMKVKPYPFDPDTKSGNAWPLLRSILPAGELCLDPQVSLKQILKEMLPA